MRTRILTIALAAVLGLLGVVAVVAYAHRANQRAVAGLNPATIWIADNAIPAGTSLKTAKGDGSLISETVPAKSAAADAVQSVNSHNEHMRVSTSMVKGQELFQSMLTSTYSASQGGGLGLKSDLIAVTVNLCLDEAVGEYATANTNVAVFDTVLPRKPAQRTCDAQRQAVSGGDLAQAETLLVLPSVQVLAVGQDAAAQSTSQNDISTTTVDPASSSASSSSSGEVLVTLAVNQAQAEQLIKIEELGMPYLGLLGQTAKTVPDKNDPLFRGSTTESRS